MCCTKGCKNGDIKAFFCTLCYYDNGSSTVIAIACAKKDCEELEKDVMMPKLVGDDEEIERRARRARREPWGLSPPGARGRADLPGDRAAAGGRGHPIPKGGRAGKENRFDRITFCLETCDERPLPLMSRNGYVPASESPADGWD